MKAVLQRVHFAKVEVNGTIIGEIQQGVLVYLGLGHDDTLTIGQKMIDKILTYRIFEDDNGKMGKSVQDVAGGVLLVSQFTLLANTRSGRRPDFKPAMSPDIAKPLFDEIVNYAKSQYTPIATGEFGANMQISSCNDGPINFVFDID